MVSPTNCLWVTVFSEEKNDTLKSNMLRNRFAAAESSTSRIHRSFQLSKRFPRSALLPGFDVVSSLDGCRKQIRWSWRIWRKEFGHILNIDEIEEG